MTSAPFTHAGPFPPNLEVASRLRYASPHFNQAEARAMPKINRVVYPGTFDPMTNGHLDLAAMATMT